MPHLFLQQYTSRLLFQSLPKNLEFTSINQLEPTYCNYQTLSEISHVECQEKNCPPENFYPRIKIFSNCVKIFCPTLKIFVRLARPCLEVFSSMFSVLLAACECFFLLFIILRMILFW